MNFLVSAPFFAVIFTFPLPLGFLQLGMQVVRILSPLLGAI